MFWKVIKKIYIYINIKNIIYIIIKTNQDKRSKSIFEFFTGIKIIKYYAWEEMV